MTKKTKDKVSKARKALSKLTERERSLLLERGLIMTIEGQKLSAHNTIALYSQGCNDSVVGGYQQWRKAGRQVRKGQSGFVMWFPAAKRGDTDNEKPRFFTTTVFAMSQTDPIDAPKQASVDPNDDPFAIFDEPKMKNEPLTYRDKVEKEARYSGRESMADNDVTSDCNDSLSSLLPSNNGYTTFAF